MDEKEIVTRIELYPDEIGETKNRSVLRIMGIIAAAAVAGSVFILFRTTPYNARMMYFTLLAFFLPAGWAEILLWHGVVKASRISDEHWKFLHSEDRVSRSGAVSKNGNKVRLPGGLELCQVELTDACGRHILHLDLDKADRFPDRAERIKVYTVHDYIVAYEEGSS